MLAPVHAWRTHDNLDEENVPGLLMDSLGGDKGVLWFTVVMVTLVAFVEAAVKVYFWTVAHSLCKELKEKEALSSLGARAASGNAQEDKDAFNIPRPTYKRF